MTCFLNMTAKAQGTKQKVKMIIKIKSLCTQRAPSTWWRVKENIFKSRLVSKIYKRSYNSMK
jgi:hypothetical protein